MKNNIDKDKVYKRYGWKPDHGDYSVSKEIKGNKSTKKSKNSIATKIELFIKAYRKF